MGVIRNYVQRRAVERIPTPLLDLVGKAILRGVDAAAEHRWEEAKARAERAKGDTVDEKVASLRQGFNRELVSLGAATGAAAAVPGFGTVGAASLLVGEAGWFSLRSTDLIMSLGAVYGHTNSTVEERRAWVLAVLAFGEEAAEEFATLMQGITPEVTSRTGQAGAVMAGVLQGDVATVDALRRVNTTLAARVTARYGSRRGLAFLGRLVPFGIGAVVGGTANWALTRTMSGQAVRFFEGYHIVIPPPPPTAADAAPAPAELPPPPMALPPGVGGGD